MQPGGQVAGTHRAGGVKKQVERLRDQLSKTLRNLDVLFNKDCTRAQARTAWNAVFYHDFWAKKETAEESAAKAFRNTVVIKCGLARKTNGLVYKDYKSASVGARPIRRQIFRNSRGMQKPVTSLTTLWAAARMSAAFSTTNLPPAAHQRAHGNTNNDHEQRNEDEPPTSVPEPHNASFSLVQDEKTRKRDTPGSTLATWEHVPLLPMNLSNTGVL